jgi:hypothetical protein
VGKIYLYALLMASILCSLPPCGSSAGREKSGDTSTAAPEETIKISIATGGGPYGPVKSQFKVGEDIPVSISMTNNSDKPVKYCLSTSLFQNRPQLKRDGELLPHLTNLAQQAERENAIQRCERSAARQFYVLQPRQTKVVDWLTISLRGIAWYAPLHVGHYELVLMRRIECCQGPWSESNKVSFEIVP